MKKPIKKVYYIVTPFTKKRLKELNEYYENKFEIVVVKV